MCSIITGQNSNRISINDSIPNLIFNVLYIISHSLTVLFISYELGTYSDFFPPLDFLYANTVFYYYYYYYILYGPSLKF
jgi:hypothetical protein